MNKTASPSKERSLFKLYVVFNYKYPNSTDDVTKDYYSIDTEKERAYGYNIYPDRDMNKFLGINYFIKFVQKLESQGVLKKAMIYANRGTREQQTEIFRFSPDLPIIAQTHVTVTSAAPVQAYKPNQFAKEPMSIGSFVN